MKYFKAFLFLIPVILLVACSKAPKTDESRLSDNRVVLQVGDHKMTMGDIEKRLGKATFRDPQEEFERKKAFVNQTMERFLLIEGAKKEGFTATVDSASERRFLLRGYYNEKIMSKVKTTDGDVDDFFKRYGGELQTAHILVADSAQAESLYNAIKNGSDFEDLARKFSTDKLTAEKGGSLGYITYGRFEDAFQDKAFSMKPGEISHPVHTRYGWHIIKVNDRIKNTKEDFEKDKNRYRDLANQYMQKKRVGEFIDKLEADNHYEVVKATKDMMIRKADSIRQTATKPPSLNTSSYLDSTSFTDAEKQMYVVKYDGGGVKVGELMDLFKTYSPQRLPDLRDDTNMKLVFEGMAMPPLLQQMAIKEGYDKTEDYKNEIQNYRDGQLAQQMRDKVYKSLSDISDEEIKQYYDSHGEDFVMPDQVRVNAIAVKTEKEANDLLDRIKLGANFGAMAKKYSIDRTTGSQGGDLGLFSDARNTEIYKAAEGLANGTLGGPVQMTGNWWIFQIVERIHKGPKRFDLVKNDIISRIRSQKQTTVYKDWMEKEKKEVPVTLNLDLLEKNLKTTAATGDNTGSKADEAKGTGR